jgi:hypothetical protein
MQYMVLYFYITNNVAVTTVTIYITIKKQHLANDSLS